MLCVDAVALQSTCCFTLKAPPKTLRLAGTFSKIHILLMGWFDDGDGGCLIGLSVGVTASIHPPPPSVTVSLLAHPAIRYSTISTLVLDVIRAVYIANSAGSTAPAFSEW